MLDIDQARTAIRREVATVLDDLREMDDEAWSRPTRCAGWSVRDLVAHLVWGQRLEGQGIASAVAGRTTPVEVPPTSTSDGEGLIAELEAAHLELVDALDSVTAEHLGKPAPMPYGQIPLPVMLQLVTMEVGVHRSDLNAALGQPYDLAPDVVAATAAFIAAFLPVVAAAGTRPERPLTYRLCGLVVDLTATWDGSAWSVGGSAEPVAAAIGGADSDLCLFALGRVGLEAPSLTVDGDRAAADRFKEYVPGP